MTSSTKYWIWLSLALGFDSRKPSALLNIYDDIGTLYDGGERELRFCGIFTESEINHLISTDIKKAEDIIKRCDELGYDIIGLSDPDYPECLRRIATPPSVIYISGKLPDVDGLDSVAIIGTRKATVYGVRTAFELGANLSKEGFIIVSGGALGIDCAAHRGVLTSNGVTICVLGCGIDYDYLRENKAMRAQITLGGAVISEYPPGYSTSPRNFPQRNRIISGLSKGVIVVEAPCASGSMITVNLALEQGRDVFSVMGNVDSVYSEGTNELIKGGAVPVTSYKDVLEYYRGVVDTSSVPLRSDSGTINKIPTKLKDKSDSTKTDNKPVAYHRKDVYLTEDEMNVYYLITTEPIHIDRLTEQSGLPAYKILSIISSLELSELIVNIGGRNYIIK